MLDELVQLLCEKKSKDLINDMRYELKYARKGEQAFCVQKIPQIIPAATYRKVKGVIQTGAVTGVGLVDDRYVLVNLNFSDGSTDSIFLGTDDDIYLNELYLL